MVGWGARRTQAFRGGGVGAYQKDEERRANPGVKREEEEGGGEGDGDGEGDGEGEGEGDDAGGVLRITDWMRNRLGSSLAAKAANFPRTREISSTTTSPSSTMSSSLTPPSCFTCTPPTHALQLPFKHLHRLLRLPYPPVPLENPLARVPPPPPGDVPTPPALRQFRRPFFHPAAEAFNIAPRLLQLPQNHGVLPNPPPPRYTLSSQSRARATGGDALGEARLARPLVGQAVAAPVAGERGLPTEDVWERPEVGEGLAKPAQSCCVARSAWPPVPPGGPLGGGAASAAPRASVSVIPFCRQGCRREANPTQTPCSGDVPTTCSGDVLATFQWPLERHQNVAGTRCWNVAGTVENRHSSARAQGALRALRPRGGGGGASTTKIPCPFMGMGHEQ